MVANQITVRCPPQLSSGITTTVTPNPPHTCQDDNYYYITYITHEQYELSMSGRCDAYQPTTNLSGHLFKGLPSTIIIPQSYRPVDAADPSVVPNLPEALHVQQRQPSSSADRQPLRWTNYSVGTSREDRRLPLCGFNSSIRARISACSTICRCTHVLIYLSLKDEKEKQGNNSPNTLSLGYWSYEYSFLWIFFYHLWLASSHEAWVQACRSHSVLVSHPCQESL